MSRPFLFSSLCNPDSLFCDCGGGEHCPGDSNSSSGGICSSALSSGALRDIGQTVQGV